MSGKHFKIQVHCDLDLWPTDQEGSSTTHDQSTCEIWRQIMINGFQDNQRKPF